RGGPRGTREGANAGRPWGQAMEAAISVISVATPIKSRRFAFRLPPVALVRPAIRYRLTDRPPPNQYLVKAEESDHQGRPREPRPDLQPTRCWPVRFNPKPEKGPPVRPFDGNFHIPAASFREFEDGRVQEPIGRRCRGGRAFQGASVPGRLQAHGHLRLRQP